MASSSDGRRGGNHSRSRQNAQTGPKPWGYQRLKELANKTPREILFEVTHEGFILVLDKEHLKPDWIFHILEISAKACTYTEKPSMLLQFLAVLKKSKFFKEINQYISGNLTTAESIVPVRNLICLFRTFMERMTSSVNELMPTYATLKFVVGEMELRSNEEKEAIEREVEELGELMTLARKEARSRAAAAQPPDANAGAQNEDFRNIPIIPSSWDILSPQEPLLEKNKLKGSYRDMDHYLSVHFRLLREDMVRPLRKNIAAFRDGDEETCHQIRKTSIYENVRLLYPVCTNEGIAFRIQFDISRFRNFHWESSKRLLYGSLVCLTADNFKSFVFASVRNRDDELIRQGMIDISCSTADDTKKLQALESKVFIVTESPAYFESYRHVLQGLQDIDIGSFPFQMPLVKCEFEPSPPAYLSSAQSSVYDIKCLTSRKRKHAGMDEEEPFELHVVVQEEAKWPPASTLGLNESQLEALQTALCQSLALIQGPPGTGKTFLGLKIVQILLQNQSCWMDNLGAEGSHPLLVVCYTNHALDQFLEGISQLQTECKVFRVGGRSKSEVLRDKNLKVWRRKYREEKRFPHRIHLARVDLMKNHQTVQSDIEKGVAALLVCDQGIIHEEHLMGVMSESHQTQLFERVRYSSQYERKPFGINSCVVQWLSLSQAASLKVEGPLPEMVPTDELVEDQIEDQVQRMIELRMLEDDDDDDFQSNTKNNSLVMQDFLPNMAIMLNQPFIEKHKLKPDKLQLHKSHAKLFRLLHSVQPMDSSDADKVKDIWKLDVRERWSLYKAWLEGYKEHIKESIWSRAVDFERLHHSHEEVLAEEDFIIASRSHVIGMTTTAAAKYRDLLQKLSPRIIVLEEAAEVLEAHVITTLSPSCQHLIMIGDHLQLRPSTADHEIATKYGMRVSLFERLVKNGAKCVTLNTQHRMRPEIAELVKDIYPSLMNAPAVRHYEEIRGIGKNFFLVHHRYEEKAEEGSLSASNSHESEFITRLCCYLLLQGYAHSQITILTPYAGQLKVLKGHMRGKDIKDVRACTIDNFQGEENDIILLSLVRSNLDEKIGFLAENNRICVLMSRAKMGFFVIGNFPLFAEQSELWRKIVNRAIGMGCYGRSLPLVCRNHPQKKIAAAQASDFDQAPEGGCMEACPFRMPCGHACGRACHAYDTGHEEIMCLQPCQRKCPRSHQCRKKCSEDCGQCQVLLKVRMRLCGHVIHLKCYQADQSNQCTEKCSHRLPCGHLCQKKCGEPHTQNCTQEVVRTLPCGHDKKVPCHVDPSVNICTEKCRFMLKCDHPCAGTCGECYQGRFHKPCGSPCTRILVCGHECMHNCMSKCPPCRKPCENQCVHSKCPNKCGQPCQPCVEPCSWVCKHHRCSRTCHERCDRPRCNAPCKHPLRCNHPCIGLCGERCPSKCRVCDQDEVEEILFGSEDDPKARFVQLEDCGHLFEVDGLDRWIDRVVDTSEGQVAVTLPTCPKCKTPIRRNLRYGCIINDTLNSIEHIKEKVSGNTARLKRMVEELQDEVFDLQLRMAPHQWTSILLGQISTLEHFTAIENLCKFHRALKTLEDDIAKYARTDEVQDLYTHCKKAMDDMTHWMSRRIEQLSEQELEDGCKEVGRLRLIVHCCEAVLYDVKQVTVLDPPEKVMLKNIRKCLTTGQALRDEEDETRDSLDKIIKRFTRLGISEKERIQIVQALGFGQGHWYKCPNGHIYAIGDCGGAVMTSSCPECGLAIGGSSHRLLDSNAAAPEMFGGQNQL